MEKEPITSSGLEKLKKELEELKNIKRPKIIQAIAEARAHGDLKENAEYHAAKEQQAQLESRVIEINNLIAIANVIAALRCYTFPPCLPASASLCYELCLGRKCRVLRTWRYFMIGGMPASLSLAVL